MTWYNKGRNGSLLKSKLVDLVFNKKAKADSSVSDVSTTTEQENSSFPEKKAVMQINTQRALKGNQ